MKIVVLEKQVPDSTEITVDKKTAGTEKHGHAVHHTRPWAGCRHSR